MHCMRNKNAKCLQQSMERTLCIKKFIQYDLYKSLCLLRKVGPFIAL